MLRSFALAVLTLCSVAMSASAGAELGDDLAACRDRQTEPRMR